MYICSGQHQCKTFCRANSCAGTGIAIILILKFNMSCSKRKSDAKERSDKGAKLARVRAETKELQKEWRRVDLRKESFTLPEWDLLDRRPTFLYRKVTLLQIFLKFMSPDLVTLIAAGIDPQRLLYNSETLFSLSLCKIYKSIAVWIRIYGAQHFPPGVKKSQRPLRQQLVSTRSTFEGRFPIYLLWDLSFLKRLQQFFLLDSRYSGQLSANFRSILRGIGCTIAGDEKLS